MWTRARYPQSDRSDKLKLTSTGSGGLAELREQLDDSKASYAYARVQYSNDKESIREKFILIVWIGPNCKVMRKAKVRSLDHIAYTSTLCVLFRLVLMRLWGTQISVHAADVKSVLRVFSIEVPAREKDDLKEEPIVVKLRKVRTGLDRLENKPQILTLRFRLSAGGRC